MAGLIQSYEQRVRTVEGIEYEAQAWGAADGHVWHGWLEFVPIAGGPTLRTERETTQPDRDALGYWASGLQAIYLEGAFGRARAGRTSTAVL